MNLLDLLFRNPQLFIVLVILLLYSIIFHEVAHGWVAYLFGDTTAKRMGRLSLNPISHIDPVGTLMLFIVGFGWANPVPVDYRNFRNFRLGLLCVSLAGCAANILIAIIAILLLRIPHIQAHPVYPMLLAVVIKINIVLGAFNLIPIPPLDGSKLVMSFLPEPLQRKFALLEPYGFFILAILLFTRLLDPVINFMQGVIYSLIALLFSSFQ